MSFRVMARTVLQLGAELISSDGIAFYELIKNAFDAGSPRIDIDVVIRLPYDDYIFYEQKVLEKQKVLRTNLIIEQEVMKLGKEIVQKIDVTGPDVEKLKKSIFEAKTWEDLLDALDGANYILFHDTGNGMSLQNLDNDFLTIGTRTRLKQREGIQDEATSRPILGEKGLGRLSTMRLGWRLRVKSSTKNDRKWNFLKINWRLFSHDSDALVEDISIKPTEGAQKKEPETSGTWIKISGLTSEWSEAKLKEISSSELSKLTDPFLPKSNYPISLRLNEQHIAIPPFNKLLFDAAHGVVQAEYTTSEGNPTLSGKINYILRDRQKTFFVELAEIVSITDSDKRHLRSLGPFSVSFYWFNRQILEAIDGIGNSHAVRRLLSNWSGGLMLFRDGFRVNPYGNPDDDWLDLDRKALASAGYKVNRRQIVGKVCISSINNPKLNDQTNRQGLRDCDEKEILKKLLKHVIETKFRAFLNSVEEELRGRLSLNFNEIADKIETEAGDMKKSVSLLLNKYPQIKEDPDIHGLLESPVRRIGDLLRGARQLSDSFERNRAQLVNLAGLGLMVEILAHELNRAVHHALLTLADTDFSDLSPGAGERLSTLNAQLKTLKKRIRILDPLSEPRRQVKESFDLVAWVREILNSHNAQFERHGILYTFSIEPEHSQGVLQVRMVKGMIVQILENLISNSVYWLKQQKKMIAGFKPDIEIVLNLRSRELSVTDNGPGVAPSNKEEIFQPFVTNKPPGEGKGLGLYIAREIAHYNESEIILSDESMIQNGRLNTFVLILGGGKK